MRVAAVIVALVVLLFAAAACFLPANDPETAPWTMVIRRYDVAPLIADGYSADQISQLIPWYTTGPWEKWDGEGGMIMIRGGIAIVRAHPRCQQEIPGVIAWLASTDEFAFLEPKFAKAVAVLDQPVTIDLPEATLVEALAALSKATGYRFEHDGNPRGTAPSEAAPIVAENERAWDVCRRLPTAWTARDEHIAAVDGCLLVGTSMKINVQTVTGSSLPATEDLARRIQESTQGPWESIDGDGARILIPRPGTLLISAELRTAIEARDAWHKLRDSGPLLN